ncbi:fumarylacetoacetate hydrolase family protein [Sphingomonas sp. AAP5]|uniref:fumarylacetoacetate hydrolase family protein n=1 Tax=Sphingomonas sp. AAP5 TaxID=1523415 RepID=UPI0010573C3B|nr:fumarylacetoacetate hydrolase family protein [Sphingomonas sp. AAP5]QBM75146.1 fumarylacetoacetate hydrolase family protein [Sphingomonas sp. AAP5]
MKLLRYAAEGGAGLGVLQSGHEDKVVPLTSLAHDFPTMLSIIEGGEAALSKVRELAGVGEGAIDLAGLRLLAPLERPGKYLAIGMNYAKHIAEAKRLGQPTPDSQFWFNKQTSCLSGPFDEIDPGVTEQLDYEAELGVVIGRAAKGVTEDQAKDYVFGYVVANDVSARDWQKRSPTFTLGKSFDTHGPIGPWIVTADEILNPHALQLRCLVNGEVRQDANTSELVYNVWQQISYLSTAFTLNPGDLLATGTPSGVGIGMQPPRFLKQGDVVRCEIEGIGAIENRVGGQ